jgi:hypothetical protein
MSLSKVFTRKKKSLNLLPMVCQEGIIYKPNTFIVPGTVLIILYTVHVLSHLSLTEIL